MLSTECHNEDYQIEEFLDILDVLISIGRRLRDGYSMDASLFPDAKTSPTADTDGEVFVHRHPNNSTEGDHYEQPRL